MRRFLNYLKDLLYDVTDYSLIIAVVVVIGAILIWRFNILFDIKVAKEPIKQTDIPVVEKPIETPSDNSEHDLTPETPDTPDDSETPNKEPSITDIDTSGEYIEVNIPQGTLPNEIAEVLLDKGLITDKKDFLNKAIELELDRKLQCGDFSIKKGSKLEDIIKTIARIN